MTSITPYPTSTSQHAIPVPKKEKQSQIPVLQPIYIPYENKENKQPPTLYQPISILPETKKDKHVPGSSLYRDNYNFYRALEHFLLFSVSKQAYSMGAVTGLIKGCLQYALREAPKKIAQDAEIIDFGGAIHLKGLNTAADILSLKFLGPVGFLLLDYIIMGIPLIDKTSELQSLSWVSNFLPNRQIINLTTLATGVKLGFIATKAASLSDEIVQRIANFWDIPSK